MSIVPAFLRQTSRRLAQQAGFTAVVVLTLALGIGANTTIFSVVNAVVLRPLPYPDAERIVQLNHFYPSLNNLEASVSAFGFTEYSRRATSFDALSAQASWHVNLTGDGEPERLLNAAVSADYFRVYGVEPAFGRTFTPAEMQPGNARVAILSHALWQRRFGGARDVIGRTMLLNSEPYEIVGVLPASYRDPMSTSLELLTPLALTPEQTAAGLTNEWLLVMARLRPTTTLQRAAQEMGAVASQLAEETQAAPAGWTVTLTPLEERARGSARAMLILLLGAVGFVLLIACTNVANLLLARGAGRMREMAVRSALGASRAQIFRHHLGESVVMAAAGGAGGLLLSLWTVHSVGRFVPEQFTGEMGITIDGPVLLFTLLMSLVSALLFGVAPALQAIRRDATAAIGRTARGSSDPAAHRIRRALVVAELALALTLLVGAGLLIRSFATLQDVDPGFRPERLVTFGVSLPMAKYETNEQRVLFFDQLLERLAALPDASAAAATTLLPFSGNVATRSFVVEGYELAENEPSPWGEIRWTSPEYAATLGIALRRGRFFEERDRTGAPLVAVIDEEFARRYFGDADPIGRRVAFPGAEPVWREIIGVVAHTKHDALDGEDRIQLYLPYRQATSVNGLTYAVRTRSDPTSLINSVRETVRSVDAEQPLHSVATMEELMSNTLAQRRFTMALLGAFAALALLLAGFGIYGVMAQLVTERTRELGVRMALGAQSGDLLRLVLRQGALLTAIGVAAGVAGAAALSRVLESQLYGVAALDPATFIGVATILTAVSLLATGLPAWRASRLHPTVALRQE